MRSTDLCQSDKNHADLRLDPSRASPCGETRGANRFTTTCSPRGAALSWPGFPPVPSSAARPRMSRRREPPPPHVRATMGGFPTETVFLLPRVNVTALHDPGHLLAAQEDPLGSRAPHARPSARRRDAWSPPSSPELRGQAACRARREPVRCGGRAPPERRSCKEQTTRGSVTREHRSLAHSERTRFWFGIRIRRAEAAWRAGRTSDGRRMPRGAARPGRVARRGRISPPSRVQPEHPSVTDGRATGVGGPVRFAAGQSRRAARSPRERGPR